ncbi:unnamed protein product [Nezara viridula]|uniref:Uncharacterized protein n=1 Tax=Nezara viridula TaxID=85310 RepID=A0A9P0EDP5_NEZVI|nr:unnamed protein product [Nezara viridula]
MTIDEHVDCEDEGAGHPEVGEGGEVEDIQPAIERPSPVEEHPSGVVAGIGGLEEEQGLDRAGPEPPQDKRNGQEDEASQVVEQHGHPPARPTALEGVVQEVAQGSGQHQLLLRRVVGVRGPQHDGGVLAVRGHDEADDEHRVEEGHQGPREDFPQLGRERPVDEAPTKAQRKDRCQSSCCFGPHRKVLH